MKFIWSGTQSSDRTRASLDRFLAHWKKHQFGMYAVCLKPARNWIGYCGLRYFEQTSDIEVGYILAKDFWGNGYATEAARTCLDHAFRR